MDKSNQETTLLKIIGRFSKLIDEFNQNKKQNMNIVLLIGVTGSGKSTIYNFQCGADFIINDKKELEIKNPSNKFSKMVGGMNSVTKEPNFYHNSKNNHLIIDFPGFQDTNGEWDQLLFELLFYKIVTAGPLKIIYVIKNPENSLPNRGSDLQEFIKLLCLKGNINIQKFNLLLNCYLEDLSEEELKDKIKEDLQSANILQSIDKILVLRKAKKNNEIQEIFNNEQRQILWQQIEQMQSIKILPQKLPKSEIISDYLRSTTLKTIEKYGNVLCEIFDNSYSKLSDAQSEQIYTKMQQILNVIKKENLESPLKWYINFISICEQLAKILSVQCDIVQSSNNFKQIFTYFSQFSDLIKGYDEMTIIKSIAEDQLKKIEKIISVRLEILQKAKEDRAKINEIEKQKQSLQQSMWNCSSQIKQLKNKLEGSDKENQQKQQEINEINRQLDRAKQQYTCLDVLKYKELKEQNQRQKKMIENLRQQKIENQQQQQQEETDNLKRKLINYENKIDSMEKKITDLEKRPTTRSSSPCQIF